CFSCLHRGRSTRHGSKNSLMGSRRNIVSLLSSGMPPGMYRRYMKSCGVIIVPFASMNSPVISRRWRKPLTLCMCVYTDPMVNIRENIPTKLWLTGRNDAENGNKRAKGYAAENARQLNTLLNKKVMQKNEKK